jgi:hypothetical protein
VLFRSFHKGFEPIAEKLSLDKELKMSHRMPLALITRNPADDRQITRYVSTEFSFLPPWAAANEGTTFGVSKESAMLTTEKKEFMRQKGFTDEQIAVAETLSKEVEVPAIEKEAEVKTESEKVEVIESVKEKDVETKETLPAEVKEVIEAVQAMPEVLKALAEQIKSLAETQATQAAILARLSESDEAKVKEKLDGTPTASRSSMKEMIQAAIGGTDAARIDGRTTLAKDGPAQTDPGNTDFFTALMKKEDWTKTLPIQN